MSANLLLKQQIQRSFYDIAMLHGLSLIDEIGQKYFGKKVGQSFPLQNNYRCLCNPLLCI